MRPIFSCCGTSVACFHAFTSLVLPPIVRLSIRLPIPAKPVFTSTESSTVFLSIAVPESSFLLWYRLYPQIHFSDDDPFEAPHSGHIQGVIPLICWGMFSIISSTTEQPSFLYLAAILSASF